MIRSRLLPVLAALVLLQFLGACATRSPTLVAPPVRLAMVPMALKLPCADPTARPERDLSTTDPVRLWGRDRAALGACRDRHRALADATSALAGQGR